MPKVARIHADKAPNWTQRQLQIIQEAGELCPEAFEHLRELMAMRGRQSQVAQSACKTVLEVAMKAPASTEQKSDMARALAELETKPAAVQARVLRQLADGLEGK